MITATGWLRLRRDIEGTRGWWFVNRTRLICWDKLQEFWGIPISVQKVRFLLSTKPIRQAYSFKTEVWKTKGVLCSVYLRCKDGSWLEEYLHVVVGTALGRYYKRGYRYIGLEYY